MAPLAPRHLLLSIAILVSFAASTFAQTYVFGTFKARIRPQELAPISELARKTGGSPWALRADDGPDFSPWRFVQAFLPPAISTNQLRRGVVLGFNCKADNLNAPCLRWEPSTEDDGHYAQVAAGTPFGAALGVRSDAERPFRVHGSFTDADLLSLVAFIRSKPHFPGRGYPVDPYGVTLRYPIASVSRRGDGSVEVVLTGEDSTGETAIVRLTPKGWALEDFRLWIT